MTSRRLVFIDSGVLIAAARGNHDLSNSALRILDDPNLKFGSSAFVRLEVLPKAVYENQQAEARFYEAFFQSVSVWAELGVKLVEHALSDAKNFGLSAMDALHVASAVELGAEELITTEKPSKPLHRSSAIPVRSVPSDQT